MLTILGERQRFCDGISRHNFLKIGAMAFGGLTLTDLLAAEARAGTRSSQKAVIVVYLPGGPAHQDTFDLKPDAPSEMRGEFKPIKTNVPGIEICEHAPRLAQMMDKFTLIRSIADSDGAHDCYQCMTGHIRKDRAPQGGWPMMGAWVSKLEGSNRGIPANVALMYPTGNRTWGEPGTGGFIGPVHAPINLVAKDPNAKAQNMTLEGITLERLRDRDQLRRA